MESGLHPPVTTFLPLVGPSFPALWNSVRAFAFWTPRQAEALDALPFRGIMAHQLDDFHLNYNRNGSQDSDEVPHLPQSLADDPALIDFPDSHVANYDFSMLPHQNDISLGFDRIPDTQVDLEGRLSNVMLSYDSVPSSAVSMPLSLDAANAFSFAPTTTFPATSMGIAPTIDNSQIHASFSPFSQHLPPTTQYTQQSQTPLAHREPNNSASSTTSVEDSDFSRSTEQAQFPARQTAQERARQPPFGPSTSLRGPQPVAIQPKKPVVAKGKLPRDLLPCLFPID